MKTAAMAANGLVSTKSFGYSGNTLITVKNAPCGIAAGGILFVEA